MKWKITDNGSGASMVVEGDDAPDQNDAQELFQSDQGRKVVQQFKTQKKADLRKQRDAIQPTSTLAQLPAALGGMLLEGAPKTEQEYFATAAAQPQTAEGGSVIPALNEFSDLINQMAPATTALGRAGQSIVKGAVGLGKGATGPEMVPAALGGGPFTKAMWSALMVKSGIETPMRMKAILDRPGPMTDKDKQDLSDAYWEGAGALYLGAKTGKEAFGEFKGPMTAEGPFAPAPEQGPAATGEVLQMPPGAKPPPPVKPLMGEQGELPLQEAVDTTKNNGAPATAEALKDQQTKGEQHAEGVRSDKEEPAKPREEPKEGEADRRGDVQQTAPREGEGAAPQETPIDHERTEGEAIAKEAGEPEKIVASAVRKADGTIESGANHPDVLLRLGIPGFQTRESRNTPDFGFVTDKRPFVSRQEGTRVANRSGQAIGGPKPEGHQLHSDEVAHPEQPDKPLGSVPQAAAPRALDPVEQWLEKAIHATDPLRGGRALEGVTGAPVWITKSLANGALRATRVAWRTGKDIAKAIESGVKWLRDQGHPSFNEGDARAWLDSVNPESQKRDIKQLRIGTRFPTVVDPELDPIRDQPEVNLEALQKAPEVLEQTDKLIRQWYPQIKPGATPLESMNNFIRHAADNLKWLYHKMQPELRARARLWYEGARTIAIRWGNEYGLSREGTAGLIAVLSPGRDWFQNLEIARRVLKVVKDPPFKGKLSPKMKETIDNYINYTGKGALSEKTRAKIAPEIPALKKNPWKKLTLFQKAIWLRAWNDAHGDYGFNVWSPEGHEMGPKLNDDRKTPAKLTMTSFGNLMVAIDTVENPTLQNISKNLGQAHKVRNFYNNIINPNNADYWDVTVDTHAVGAGLLRPVGQKARPVSHNFGTKPEVSEPGEEGPGSSGHEGLAGGFYALHADAARLAAREIAAEVPGEEDITARALQSITWEAVRTLFSDKFKDQEGDRVKAGQKGLVDEIWDKYISGEISIDEARDQIFNLQTYDKKGKLLKAGGLSRPDWAETTRDRGGAAAEGTAGEPGELPGGGGSERGRPDSGRTGDVPSPDQGGVGGQTRGVQVERGSKLEALLDKAIEATRPGTKWTGRTALGIGQVPVWLAQEGAHGALRAVRVAYRASKDIGKAIQAGIDWMRDQKLRGFNEDDARKWLTATITPQGPVTPEQTHGIAARVSAQAAAEGVIPPVVPGTGVQAEAAVRQGQADLRAGFDPNAIAEYFKRTGNVSARGLGVVRAHSENLRRAASDRSLASGSPEYLAAKAKDFDFLQNVVKPMQTAWHAMGQVQQGEVEIDTGTFHGLNRAYLEDTGQEIPPAKQPKAEKIAADNKDAQDKTGKAKKEITGHLKDTDSEVSRVTKETEPDFKAVRDAAVKLAELENKQRIAAAGERKIYDDQIKAAKRAMDAVWKVHRDHAARIAKNETVKRVVEAQRQREIYDIQEQAAQRALDAAAQVGRDAASAAAKAENDARVADAQRDKDLQAIEERRKQAVKQATDKATRDAATRAAEAEKKARVAKAKAEKELAQIEADRQRKARDAAAKRARDIAADRAQRTREMQANPDLRVWKQAKVYLDQGLDNFDEIRHKVATDLGMTVDQVTNWLAYDKRAKFLADDLWKKQQKERLLKNQAKRWLTDLEVPTYRKALGAIPRTMFNLKVGFHGTVALATHAPVVAFQPKFWKTYVENFGKMYRMVASPAYYERQVQDLMRRKNYITAQRSGLINDPFHYEDFNSPETSSYWKDFTEMGNRGYSVLKILRQDMFDQMWDQLPKTSQIEEVASALADGINHSTGVVKNLPGSQYASKVLFAPKLEASRAAWFVGDTVRAGNAMLDWKNSNLGEKTFAMNYLKERLWIAGTYASMLALNQGFLSAMGSKQQVNATDPFKADWLKFKVAGENVSYGNPMLTLMRLPVRLWVGLMNEGKLNKLVYEDENTYKIIGDYLRSQASPFAGVTSDLAFGRDYMQRPLPRAGFGFLPGKTNMPKRLRAQGVQPYTWTEYALETGSMIPVEEVLRDVFANGMGMSQDQQKDVFTTMLQSSFKAGLMAGTGARIGEDFEAKRRAEDEAVRAEAPAPAY